MWVWFVPLEAAAAFTVFAIAAGGQVLRTWLLSALVWLMTMPLFVGLEGGLIAMMLFEPVRGVARRAQYLFVDYSAQDPIHLLTPIVTLCALVLLLRSRRLEMFVATPLAGTVSILGALYFLEIFNPLQGSLLTGLGGALFMLVPLVWFYFGQSVNEAFINKALRLMVLVGIITSVYGVYQLLWGYPAFEQYWIDNTDFYDSIQVGHIRRALATFSSAEEWGRYAEIAAIAAFGFVAGQKNALRRLAWFACGVGLVGGVFLTGERTAIFGLLAGICALVLLGAKSFPRALLRIGILVLPIILIVAFVNPPSEEEMWSKSDKETVSTLLSHAQRGTLKPAEEESFQIRLENWTHLLSSVIPYRPLGAGLGAGSLSENRFNTESTLPPIDCFILVVAIACGIPGALLFVWILGRSTWFAIANARAEVEDDYALTCRIVAAIMPALVLNSIFGLTFSLYSVAPLAWLFIGWISRERLRLQQEPAREIITI
ncbi:MAG TPA: O-antigen ligase family protein [Pyrinomonadaceae bacterium]|nr:O-antigen ligase family protein [Pyrinomonadaceae bacterium]